MTNQAPQRVLVTGAAGFIGSHVVEAYLAHGDAVLGIDNFDAFYARHLKQLHLDEIAARPDADRFEFICADIRDADAVGKLFDEFEPTLVVHLAARAGVRPSIEQPALYAQVNVQGTLHLLEAARKHQGVRFLLASSSSVYGDNEKTPFSETDDVNNPISPYAATKRACELLAHTYHHLYGVPIACLRFFTVYGPRQRPDLAIAKFMRALAMGEPITMFGDGSSSRDYTYIDDIVRGVIAAGERIERHGLRIWNLGGNQPITLSSMIERIAETLGASPVINQTAAQPGDVRRTYADLSRSAAELGYKPETDFKTGLGQQWRWLQARL